MLFFPGLGLCILCASTTRLGEEDASGPAEAAEVPGTLSAMQIEVEPPREGLDVVVLEHGPTAGRAALGHFGPKAVSSWLG